jgi:hypothetical protein
MLQKRNTRKHTQTHFFLDISLILAYSIRIIFVHNKFSKSKFYILILLAGWKLFFYKQRIQYISAGNN